MAGVALHGQAFELSACVNAMGTLHLRARRKGSAGQRADACRVYPGDPGRSECRDPYAGVMATLWSAVVDRGGLLEAPYPR